MKRNKKGSPRRQPGSFQALKNHPKAISSTYSIIPPGQQKANGLVYWLQNLRRSDTVQLQNKIFAVTEVEPIPLGKVISFKQIRVRRKKRWRIGGRNYG